MGLGFGFQRLLRGRGLMPRSRWTRMAGHTRPESSVTTDRNGRSRSARMAGHDGPEYADEMIFLAGRCSYECLTKAVDAILDSGHPVDVVIVGAIEVPWPVVCKDVKGHR